jgi:hypothetical protein
MYSACSWRMLTHKLKAVPWDSFSLQSWMETCMCACSHYKCNPGNWSAIQISFHVFPYPHCWIPWKYLHVRKYHFQIQPCYSPVVIIFKSQTLLHGLCSLLTCYIPS